MIEMNRELAIKILKELAINSFEHYVNELNGNYYYDGVYIDILCQYEFTYLK